MSVKVDPNLMKDLKEFGLKDANKCFQCGNCRQPAPFPHLKTRFQESW